jgi:2-oxoisovalerate dehydrogenase E1 component beta subunit
LRDRPGARRAAARRRDQFCDYIFNTIDLLKLAGTTCWASNGDWNVPMVVRTPVGSGIRGSLYHSHSFDATMTHIPGWKIVMPSTPLDAYGLLLSACQDQNPVMVLEPKALLRMKGEELIPWRARRRPRAVEDDRRAPRRPHPVEAAVARPCQAYTCPSARGSWCVPGTDLTVVTYGRMLPLSIKAAQALEAEGISVEVIDLRSLWPYDWEMIRESVKKTGRALFVNEDTEVTNFGEHLLGGRWRTLFYELLAPPRLLAGKFVPGIGLADPLELASVPQLPDVTEAMRALARELP